MFLTREDHVFQILASETLHGRHQYDVSTNTSSCDDDLPCRQSGTSRVVVKLKGGLLLWHLTIRPLLLFDIINEDFVLISEEA